MAISASVRQASSGARSVALLVTSGAGAAETISSAQLLNGASAVELANFPIYADFLNLSGKTAPQIVAAFAALGGNLSLVGSETLSAIKWGVDGAGKPTLLVTTGAATDIAVRISLASTVSA
jgi:hypothetical protein